MTTPTANQTTARLEATFGLGRGWTAQPGFSATVWETPAYHLLWFEGAASETELRRLWEARKGCQAYLVVLLAPSDDDQRTAPTSSYSRFCSRLSAHSNMERVPSWDFPFPFGFAGVSARNSAQKNSDCCVSTSPS